MTTETQPIYKNKKTPVFVYTDGSISKNPGGIGGWAAIVRFPDGSEYEISGNEESSTSNRMEIRAAIGALEFIDSPSVIVLYSDSEYVVKGMSSWIKNWKKNNWKRGSNPPQPVINKDLWQRLDNLNQKHSVTWRWVKGHNGDKLNERADKLANKARRLAISNKINVVKSRPSDDEKQVQEPIHIQRQIQESKEIVVNKESKETISFKLNDIEFNRYQTWTKYHQYSERHQSHSFTFTPTSIGVICKCKCTCGSELEITDYKSW